MNAQKRKTFTVVNGDPHIAQIQLLEPLLIRNVCQNGYFSSNLIDDTWHFDYFSMKLISKYWQNLHFRRLCKSALTTVFILWHWAGKFIAKVTVLAACAFPHTESITVFWPCASHNIDTVPIFGSCAFRFIGLLVILWVWALEHFAKLSPFR